MRRYVVSTVLLVIAMLAIGCAAPATEDAGVTEPVAAEVPSEKQMGGTVNVWQPNGWPEPSWFHAGNWESYWAVSPMAEYLFWPKPDGTNEPMLATGYDVSEDGLVYTVHLREDVQWHDGEPFTAEDVVYSIHQRYHPEKQPAWPAREGLTIQGFVDFNEGEAERIEGISIVDEHTVEFTLTAPDAGFPRLFLAAWNYIVPKHVLEQLDPESVLNGTASYWITEPIGTGPYKFVEYAENQYIEYERNEEYWGGEVGPENLFMKIATPEVAIVMLQSGELDFVQPLSLDEVERLEEDPNVEIVVADNAGFWYGLESNFYTMDGFWRNPEARQAFLYAVNRQGYVDAIFAGYGTVRNSYFDGTPYACPTLTEYSYDPEMAEALFDEIGATMDVRESMEIDLMSWLGRKDRQDFLPIAQENLRSLGFISNVDIIDNSLISQYRDGEGPRGPDWDFHVLGLGPRADPATIDPFIRSGSDNNFGRRGTPAVIAEQGAEWEYSNPRVDELLELAAEETDFEQRKAYFQEIDCIWNEELPALTIAAPQFVAGKSVRLQGLDLQTMLGVGRTEHIYKPGDWWVWEP